MKSNLRFELIIVGGGIVGLATARAAMLRNPKQRVLVLEKEISSTRHGSGRNSGVIHSGIYYAPGSLRASMCVKGAKELCNYIDERRLWSDACGKILLPTSGSSLKNLKPLLDRASENGVVAYRLDSKGILSIEPRANTQYNDGIFIPSTRVVDPKEIVLSITKEILQKGVDVRFEQQVIGIDSKNGKVTTNDCVFDAGQIINAAGLFSDQVAELSGLELRYQFQPFKGKYWKCSTPNLKLKRLVYPIPDLDLPFLGVHTVHNREGDIYVGPSSTPAIGRENYNGFDGIKPIETTKLTYNLLRKIFLNTNGIRTLALREISLLTKSGIYNEVTKLLTDIKKNELVLSQNKVGIRSQIFDPKAEKLVTDFVVIRQDRTVHVLNAISPAFTASFSFGSFLVDMLESS